MDKQHLDSETATASVWMCRSIGHRPKNKFNSEALSVGKDASKNIKVKKQQQQKNSKHVALAQNTNNLGTLTSIKLFIPQERGTD